jgi:hypothetical protein
MRATMSLCELSGRRVAHMPLFRMNCRRRTAEAGFAVADSTRRVGKCLTMGVAALGSKRMIDT